MNVEPRTTNPNQARRTANDERVWRPLLVTAVVAYLYWLSPAFSSVAAGADSSGYLWSARLFRHGALSAPIAVPPGFPAAAVGPNAFAPLGARVRPGTWELVPTYPTGLPLHLAAANLILPEESAVRGVLIVTTGMTLVLFYLVAREAGLAWRWALAGSVVLACSPLFLFMAVQPMSDVLATLWAEATILFAWRARGRGAYAVLAGASLGIATLVRPTNVLLLLPAVAALPRAIRRYGGLVAGALPFAGFLIFYQSWTYGHPFASGYGDLSSTFSMAQIGPSLAHYIRWLPRLASWLIVLAPVAVWAWRGELVRWRLVTGAWAAVVLGIYAAYPVTSEAWWALRFVLPAFPPLIIASLAGLQELARVLARRVPARDMTIDVAAFAAAALAVLLLVRAPEFGAFRSVKGSEAVYRNALQILSVSEPSPAAVLMVQMSGAANYYAPHLRFVRYDELSGSAWQAIRRWQADTHAVVGAALLPFEWEQVLRGDVLLPCAWTPRGRYRDVTFWACLP